MRSRARRVARRSLSCTHLQRRLATRSLARAHALRAETSRRRKRATTTQYAQLEIGAQSNGSLCGAAKRHVQLAYRSPVVVVVVGPNSICVAKKRERERNLTHKRSQAPPSSLLSSAPLSPRISQTRSDQKDSLKRLPESASRALTATTRLTFEELNESR